MNVPAPLPPKPAAPVPPPVAPPDSPEMQIANAGAQLNALTAPPYAGGTPDGSLTSTPRQATADLLNSGERSKGLEREEGRIKADQATQEADVQAAQAAEKVAQASDFQRELAASNQRYEEAHAQTQAAYDAYKAQAGTLKDPETQFFEDKGTGYHVKTALAAFAAGLGAGWNGNAGNPVLDQLQKKIEANYQAHKQNIDDLYNAGVQSGKIEDTVENHAKFMQDAKLHSYELQGAHYKDQLAAIASRAQSPLAKTAAAKTIEGITNNEITLKQKLAQQEAAANAAKLAADRQRQREVREAYQKSLEKHADLAPDEARLEATKDLHALGYNASETAPIFEANGVATNPETGEPVFPESRGGTGPEEPTYDEAGKLVVPSRDAATGKQLKPEQRKAIEDEARKRTVIVEGKPQLAVSEEAAKKFAGIQSALPDAQRLIAKLKDSFAKGDKGAYDQARNQLIEISPVIYGFTRGPSAAQAGETGGGGGGSDHEGGGGGGTIAGQIPEFESLGILGTAAGLLAGKGPQAATAFANTHPLGKNTSRGIAISKLDALEQSIGHIKNDAYTNAFGGKAAGEEPQQSKSVADLAASFGGKRVGP
jgi:hypothetical protein